MPRLPEKQELQDYKKKKQKILTAAENFRGGGDLFLGSAEDGKTGLSIEIFDKSGLDQ